METHTPTGEPRNRPDDVARFADAASDYEFIAGDAAGTPNLLLELEWPLAGPA